MMEKLRKRRKRKRRSSGLFRCFAVVLVVFFVCRMYGTSALSAQLLPSLRGAANRNGAAPAAAAATKTAAAAQQSSARAMEAASRAETELLAKLNASESVSP